MLEDRCCRTWLIGFYDKTLILLCSLFETVFIARCGGYALMIMRCLCLGCLLLSLCFALLFSVIVRMCGWVYSLCCAVSPDWPVFYGWTFWWACEMICLF